MQTTTETTEQTFRDLYNSNKPAFAEIDSDLIETFLHVIGDDDAEQLESYDLHDKLDYDGSLHNLIDGRIDIYYYDLRQWSVDNYNYVEDAISEGLCEGVSDFHALIQAGQYVKLSEDMRAEVDNLTSIINDLLNSEDE